MSSACLWTLTLLKSFWCQVGAPDLPLGHLALLVHLYHNQTAPLATRIIILLMYFVRLKVFSVHVMVKVALPRSQSHSSSLLLDEYTTLWGEPEWVHACTKCGVVARNVGHASACAEHWAVACIWPLSEKSVNQCSFSFSTFYWKRSVLLCIGAVVVPMRGTQ